MNARLSCAALLLCAACAEESPAPLSQVIVLVGGEALIDELEVRIFDVESGVSSSTRTIDLSRRAQGRLPSSFSVIPGSEDSAGSFRIVVQGSARDAAGGSRKRARSEALVSFSPGQTTLLPIVLSEACGDQHCGCQDDAPCADTCVAATGSCAPVATYETLPELLPGTELERVDSGFGRCPRGAFVTPDGGCADIDECAFYVDACGLAPRACVNLTPEAGRYVCECPPGYEGSGEADDPCHPPCTDDDENPWCF